MRLLLLFLVLLVTATCTQKKESIEPLYEKETANAKQTLRFAIHPLHNPDRLNKIFGPLVSYLNKNIPEANIQVEASVNYAAFEKK